MQHLVYLITMIYNGYMDNVLADSWSIVFASVLISGLLYLLNIPSCSILGPLAPPGALMNRLSPTLCAIYRAASLLLAGPKWLIDVCTVPVLASVSFLHVLSLVVYPIIIWFLLLYCWLWGDSLSSDISIAFELRTAMT